MYWIAQQNSRYGPRVMRRPAQDMIISGPYEMEEEAFQALELAVETWRTERLTPEQRTCEARGAFQDTQNAGTLHEPILRTPRCADCGALYVPGVGKFWRHP